MGRLGRLLIPEALNKLVQILECCLTGVDNVMPLSKVMGVTRLVRMLLRFSAGQLRFSAGSRHAFCCSTVKPGGGAAVGGGPAAPSSVGLDFR